MTPQRLRNLLRRLERERRWLVRLTVALVIVDAGLWMATAGGPSFLSW